jgi:hypothetical protein
MSTNATALSRRLLRIGTIVLLLAPVSCAKLPLEASIAIPPIPPGEARVWFYRDLAPYEGLERPYTRMNGGVVGISEPGGTFYRDVPPGHYHVGVDSYLPDANMTRDVDLAPGHQVYFKVLSERVACGGGAAGGGDCEQENFYVSTMPPEVAQAAVARSQFYAGGS